MDPHINYTHEITGSGDGDKLHKKEMEIKREPMDIVFNHDDDFHETHLAWNNNYFPTEVKKEDHLTSALTSDCTEVSSDHFLKLHRDYYTSNGMNENKNLRTHIEEKMNKCNKFEKINSSKAVMSLHTQVNKGEKQYKYKYGKKCFVKKFNLVKHKQDLTSETPYKCGLCKKYFKRKSGLNQHHKRIHSSEQHKQNHTSEKPYKCGHCEKYFMSKSHLKEHHQRTHTDEKPYQCVYCEKRFVRNSDLVRHVKIHTAKILVKNPINAAIVKNISVRNLICCIT
ncbi:unnamed protein product [Meganyctiphanes norvegica]|uniref:C2H2-type domain-containing protein n=1 Tax=Meganyctiphanes norvegica TaxID=48144 RepID=A0AAV2SWR0_MEGNR